MKDQKRRTERLDSGEQHGRHEQREDREKGREVRSRHERPWYHFGAFRSDEEVPFDQPRD